MREEPLRCNGEEPRQHRRLKLVNGPRYSLRALRGLLETHGPISSASDQGKNLLARPVRLLLSFPIGGKFNGITPPHKKREYLNTINHNYFFIPVDFNQITSPYPTVILL